MGPKWPFLLMYGSHDMRHTGFPQADGGQWDPRDSGRHNSLLPLAHCYYFSVFQCTTCRTPENLKFSKSIKK